MSGDLFNDAEGHIPLPWLQKQGKPTHRALADLVLCSWADVHPGPKEPHHMLCLLFCPHFPPPYEQPSPVLSLSGSIFADFAPLFSDCSLGEWLQWRSAADTLTPLSGCFLLFAQPLDRAGLSLVWQSPLHLTSAQSLLAILHYCH